MGVESFLLSSTLIGVLAQRLLRLLCPQCKAENTTIDDQMRTQLGISADTIVYKAVGCDICSGTGYRRRNGIHELLVVDEEVQRMVHNAVSEHEIEHYAIKNLGMKTLRMDAMRWVISGKTSLEEVLSVTKE